MTAADPNRPHNRRTRRKQAAGPALVPLSFLSNSVQGSGSRNPEQGTRPSLNARIMDDGYLPDVIPPHHDKPTPAPTSARGVVVAVVALLSLFHAHAHVVRPRRPPSMVGCPFVRRRHRRFFFAIFQGPVANEACACPKPTFDLMNVTSYLKDAPSINTSLPPNLPFRDV